MARIQWKIPSLGFNRRVHSIADLDFFRAFPFFFRRTKDLELPFWLYGIQGKTRVFIHYWNSLAWSRIGQGKWTVFLQRKVSRVVLNLICSTWPEKCGKVLLYLKQFVFTHLALLLFSGECGVLTRNSITSVAIYAVVILINALTLMHKANLSTNNFGNNHFGQKYQKQNIPIISRRL